MTPTKALQRIEWRFGGNGNKHPFPVNKNDIEAYNVLEEYVKETQRKTYDANQLFAKLYVYMVMKIMEQKQTTVLDTIARKQIGNILKLPLSHLIEMLTDSMNESELYGIFKDAGVVMKHPAIRTEDENQHNRETIKGITPEQIQDKPWNYEQVESGLIAEINLMIELHG